MWSNKFLQSIILTVFMSLCLYGLPYFNDMEAGAAQEETIVAKEDKVMTGEVGFINSDFIAIIDSQDAIEGYEHEQLMYLDKDTTVKSKASLNEIKLGDTVQISYEETTKSSKGVEKREKATKEVKFLREAKTKDSSLKSGNK